jgi:hypothetical protein
LPRRSADQIDVEPGAAEAADADLGAAGQPFVGDPAAVDERAVGAAEVDDVPGSAAAPELQMSSGGVLVGDHDVRRAIPPDRDGALGEVTGLPGVGDPEVGRSAPCLPASHPPPVALESMLVGTET